MQARFLRVAEAEVNEAVAYFDEQRTGLGDRFEHDLIAAVKFVRDYPLAGKSIGPRVRKRSLRTFRYNVIYVVEQQEIIIIAVAHHRRRPGYWRSRLAKSPE